MNLVLRNWLEGFLHQWVVKNPDRISADDLRSQITDARKACEGREPGYAKMLDQILADPDLDRILVELEDSLLFGETVTVANHRDRLESN